MKLHIAPPNIARDLTIGLVTATPPAISLSEVVLDSTKINAWFHARIEPDSSNDGRIICDGGIWQLEDTSGGINGDNDGMGTVHYLLLAARRKPGNTAAISAQTIRLCSTPVYVCTANATTDTLTTTVPHGLRAGDAVKFVSGNMPGGITNGTEYFVIASGLTATVFKVSATRGGVALDITSVGSSVGWTPGEREFGRISVPAAASGAYEPDADYFLWQSKAGAGPFNFGSTAGLYLRYDSPGIAAPLEISLQVAGNN